MQSQTDTALYKRIEQATEEIQKANITIQRNLDIINQCNKQIKQNRLQHNKKISDSCKGKTRLAGAEERKIRDDKIVELYHQNFTQREIAIQFNLSVNTVAKVIKKAREENK